MGVPCRRLAAALVLTVGALIVLASPAGAHAALSSTEPAAGAILETAPEAVTLHFTEGVQVDDDSVRVYDSARTRVDTGTVTKTDARTIRVPLEDIGDGGYVVAWKVVSTDGHPIGGGFTWRVGETSTAVDPGTVAELLSEQEAGRAVGVAAGVVRFVVFASLLVLIGGAVFVSFLWSEGAARPRARRLLWWSWVVLLVATLLGIGLQGANLGGLGLLDALQPSVFGDVLDTTFGRVWLARAVLLLPVAWLLTQLKRAEQLWWRIDAVLLGVALLATPALSGHADSGRWIGAAQVADVAHLAGGAVWLGGLAVLLAAALRSDVSEARSVTERFSPVAFGAVVLVVATGTFQSVRQVTTLDAIETSYGRLLVAKIVVVLAVIGIASLTRAALQGRLNLEGLEPIAGSGPGAASLGEGDEIRILRRLVGAEVVVALAVLAITALLVDANPGYATASGSAGPFDKTVVVDDDVLINLVAVPGTLGPTDFHLYVDDPAGGLTPPVGASGSLALPGSDITGIAVTFVAAGPGHWSANDVDVPIAGRWELTVDVLLTDVDEVSTTFTIPIGGTQ